MECTWTTAAEAFRTCLPPDNPSTTPWDWKNTRVLPLTYQSQSIPFTEWVTLFTVALAPLVAHIVAGAPKLSYLRESRPRWHERICHYNPTSILWRYAAITDRRIRSRAWDTVDMAATNTVFWTSHGWDGSEEMIDTSLLQCTQQPEYSCIRIFSKEMSKTIVVTIQGAQATVWLIKALLHYPAGDSYNRTMGVDIIFFPLAIFGSFRLLAALWLTDDFLYTSRRISESATSYLTRKPSIDSLLEQVDFRYKQGRLRPVTFWGSILFRILYILPVLGFSLITFLYMLPWRGEMTYTVTEFIVTTFYVLFYAATFLICSWYFSQGATTSTVIPCIHAIWYKVYTLIVLASALVMLIIACLETRRTPCGTYTSRAGIGSDSLACQTQSTSLYTLDPANWYSFGIATKYPAETFGNGSILGREEFLVYNFTGACIGSINSHDQTATRATALDIVNNVTLVID